MGQEGYVTSAVFFPGTHNSSLIKTKTTEKARSGHILQNSWPIFIKTHQGHEKEKNNNNKKERL